MYISAKILKISYNIIICLKLLFLCFFLLIVLLIHARVFYIITYNEAKEVLIYPKDIEIYFYKQQIGFINCIGPWNYSRLSCSYVKGREREYLFIVYIWRVTSSKKSNVVFFKTKYLAEVNMFLFAKII
jgi:hypothetical protein